MTFTRLPHFLWEIAKCFWRQLSHEQQYRLRATAWGASVNVFILTVLAVIHLTTAKDDVIVVTLSFASTDQEVESFTFVDTANQLETIDEQPIVEEPLMVEAATGLEELTALPIITTSGAGMPLTLVANDTQQVESSTLNGTDSSKDPRVSEADARVAAAGGELEGPVRVSLYFDGADDIDLYVEYQYDFVKGIPQLLGGMSGTVNQNRYKMISERRIRHIWFRSPKDIYGQLDVDANARQISAKPCENIIFRQVPKEAVYKVSVNHFRSRGGPLPQRYVVVVKYGDQRQVYEGHIGPSDGVKPICVFTYRGT